jgi:hypothetical protein
VNRGTPPLVSARIFSVPVNRKDAFGNILAGLSLGGRTTPPSVFKCAALFATAYSLLFPLQASLRPDMQATTQPLWNEVKTLCHQRAEGLFPVYEVATSGNSGPAQRLSLVLAGSHATAGTLEIGSVIDGGIEGTVYHAQLVTPGSGYAGPMFLDIVAL